MNGWRSNVHSGPFHNNCYTGLYQLQHTHMYSLALLLGRARGELKCYTNCPPTAIQSAVTATARRRHCLLAQQHRAETERHWEQDGVRAQNNNDTEIAKQLPKRTIKSLSIYCWALLLQSVCGCCCWSLDRVVCNRNTPPPPLLHRYMPMHAKDSPGPATNGK